RHPRSTLFPYTTLFRSSQQPIAQPGCQRGVQRTQPDEGGGGRQERHGQQVEGIERSDLAVGQERVAGERRGDPERQPAGAELLGEPVREGVRSEEHTSELQSLAYL